MPDVSGTSIEAITHADDRLATGERVRFMLSGPDHAFCFVKRYVHKSGRIVSARVTASSVSHRGRRLLLAQICDFSDLAHAHERLEIAAENTGLGVWEADLQTLGMAWDTNLRRLYELPADAADPTIPEWLAMVVDEDRAQVQTRVARCLAVNGENGFNVEFRINRRSNGGIRWLRSSGRAQRDASGRAVRGIGINIDITEEKLIAEEREHHIDAVRRALEQTVGAITTALEIRDPYTAGHQHRVADIAVKIARRLGLPEHRISGVRLAAQVHDIGKISIPAEILCMPGRLSEAQYELVKTHARAGYEILKNVDFPWPIAEIIHQHHEQIDGTGYPRGLKGDEILLEARIIAVADTLEAMSSYRPYRPPLGLQMALCELVKKRGISYDAMVVDACQSLFAGMTELPTEIT